MNAKSHYFRMTKAPPKKINHNGRQKPLMQMAQQNWILPGSELLTLQKQVRGWVGLAIGSFQSRDTREEGMFGAIFATHITLPHIHEEASAIAVIKAMYLLGCS